MTKREAPTTAAGREMLAGFSGISGYRPRQSREVVGIRDAILAIEEEAMLRQLERSLHDEHQPFTFEPRTIAELPGMAPAASDAHEADDIQYREHQEDQHWWRCLPVKDAPFWNRLYESSVPAHDHDPDKCDECIAMVEEALRD